MSTNVLAGRYEVRSLIGRGGMAEVHLGYDTRLSRIVAVKMLRMDLAKDSIFQARFRREAQSAASLNHPNIVAVYDTGEQTIQVPDGSTVEVPYIIMEYVEGHTVRDLLADGTPVPIDEAVEIMGGVLAALQYSHAQGLVHRDIKPGNIMLTNSGKIKVMDFGIARAIEDSAATMTQTDAVVGTAQYLSPEQARGEQVDSRSDLYSAGCLLFELLTGRPPFRGDTAVSVAYQHVSELPPIPSSITSDIPESLDRVVLKSMAKRREDRYADADKMLADLRAAARGGNVNAPDADSWDMPVSATHTMSAMSAMPSTQSAQTQVQPMFTPAVSATATLQQSRMVQQKRETERRSRRRRNAVLWILFLLALAAVAVTVTLLVWTNHGGIDKEGNKVIIPTDIIGKTRAEARAQLQSLGLEMTQGDDVASETVAKDRIAQVDPGPGTAVSPGTKIQVHVSTGKPFVTIPDTANMTQDQARARLAELKLTVGSVQIKDSPDVAKGNVIGSEPKAGEQIEAGQAVTLLIASGDVLIPKDLAGKPVEEVLNILNSLKLSTNTVTEETNTTPDQHVISVSPNGKVPQGSSVTVKVAKAPRSSFNNDTFGSRPQPGYAPPAQDGSAPSPNAPGGNATNRHDSNN